MITPGTLHDASAVAPGGKLSLRADAVIVGSGAGGSAVAAELTRHGLSVVVLEEGRSFATQDLIAKPSWAFHNLYANRGVMAARGAVYIPLTAGKAVGGSTFVNSAICFRAPDHVLDEWERDYGSTWTRERMAPLFAETERAMDVAKTPPETARQNSLVFKRGADKLGLGGDFISRNAPGCVGCGVCQLGCPTGGKGSTDKNLLPGALERGANLYSEVRATQVLVENGVARGVRGELVDAKTNLGVAEVEVQAARVFLCGGALGTPQLLQRSNLCGTSGHLGENLHIHPGQGAAAIFPEPVKYWDGVTQGYYVDLEGAILETFTGTPEIFFASLPLGQMSLGRLKYVATAGCMVRDSGKGSIKYTGPQSLPALHYELTEADRMAFVRGARKLVQIYFAAGATEVWPFLNTGTDLAKSEAAALAMIPDDLPLQRLNPYGSHPQGTARLGADPKNSVCKPSGETHDVRNLYVADGSLFPSAVGVNPQITILSMATGIARDVAKAG